MQISIIHLRPLSCVLAILSVAGCSGTALGTGGTPGQGALGFDQMTDQVTSAGITAPSQVPLTGQATHTGLMEGTFDFITGTEQVTGDASLTLDYTQDTVSGQLTNLQGANSGAITGMLEIAEEDLPGPGFFTAVGGYLTVGGNATAIDGSLGGTLYGNGVTGVAGQFVGDVYQNGFEGDFDGAYVVSAGGP